MLNKPINICANITAVATSWTNVMIKSGGCFYYKVKSCIIGAVISLNGLNYMVAASHIFKGAGDCLQVDGMEVTVTHVLKDFDLYTAA